MTLGISILITLGKRHERYKSARTLESLERKYNQLVKQYTSMGSLPVFEKKLAEEEYKKGVFIKNTIENPT